MYAMQPLVNWQHQQRRRENGRDDSFTIFHHIVHMIQQAAVL
jgi:hypothetical protein